MAVATKKTGSKTKTGKGEKPHVGKGPAKAGGKNSKPHKPKGGKGNGGGYNPDNKGNGERPHGRQPMKPLKALTPNQLRRQAKQTAVSSFKGARTQLRSEEKRLNAQQKRRQADAVQFQDWLERREALFDLQGDAADAAIQHQQGVRQDAVAQRYALSEDTMLDRARSGSVSNTNVADYEGFQNNSRVDRALQMGEAQAEELSRISLDNNSMRAAISENTMATLAGMRNQQNSEYANAMKDLSDARLKLTDDQRALFVKTKDELQDRELEKAVKRSDIKLSNKKLKLEKAGLKLEYYKAKNELKIAMANNASDERIAALKNQTARAIQKLKNAGDKDSDKPEVDMTDVRARKKITREINQNIASTISWVQSNKKARKLWRQGDKAKLGDMIRKAEVPSYLVPVIFDLMGNGKLGQNSKQTLHSVGAYVKHIQGSKVKRPHHGHGPSPHGGPGNAHGG